MLTYPIVKCIFAKVFLEENIKRPLLIPSILTLIGVILIIKPHFIFDYFVPYDSESNS